MPKKPARRFLELKVGEVSLVDSPANETEFHVVKRLDQEDVDMADVNTEVAANEAVDQTTEPGHQAEQVQVEVSKAADKAVEDAMAKVTKLVETITTKAAEQPAETGEEATAEGEAETEVDVEKGDMRGKYKAQLVANGVKNKALEKAMAEFDKAFPMFRPGKAGGKPPLAKTQKNTEGEQATEPEDNEAMITKTMDALVEGIQKAKAFTPKRQETLKAAIETLQDLLKQVSMKEIPTGGNPKNPLPKGTAFGESGVIALTKRIEELTEALSSSVVETTKSLSERVEAIEKTRQPSTSVEGDGVTETKTEKSFWSGIL